MLFSVSTVSLNLRMHSQKFHNDILLQLAKEKDLKYKSSLLLCVHAASSVLLMILSIWVFSVT